MMLAPPAPEASKLQLSAEVEGQSSDEEADDSWTVLPSVVLVHEAWMRGWCRYCRLLPVFWFGP